MPILNKLFPISATLPGATEPTLKKVVTNEANNIIKINEVGLSYVEALQVAKGATQDTILPIDDTDSPFTIVDDNTETILADEALGAITVNVPASGAGLVNPGHEFTVINRTGTNTVTVAMNGNTALDGGAPYSLTTAGQVIILRYLDNDEYVRIV